MDQVEDRQHRERGEGSDEAFERSTTTLGRDMSSSAFALNERGIGDSIDSRRRNF